MIFAAGHGERMRPLSAVLPKPALPLPGGPVVAWPLRLAAAAGAHHLVVNTWHLADKMETALDTVSLPDNELLVSRESELMGTAGGLAVARDRGLLGAEGPVLVLNGDGVLHLDLEPVLKRHRSSRDLVTLALLPHLDPRQWSRVHLDGRGRVHSIVPPGDPQPGEVPLLYPGLCLVSRSGINGLPVRFADIKQQLWLPAMAKGRLGGAVVSGHWREVGYPQDYLAAAMAGLAGQSDIHPAATVADGATIGTSLIGEGARIAAGAVVAESVIAAGATVHRGARVIRSVLLGAVTAGRGEAVVNQVRAEPPKPGK